jgi:hypothetical protein
MTECVGEHSEFSDDLPWSGVQLHVIHVFNKYGNSNQVRRLKLRELQNTMKRIKTSAAGPC